MNYTLLMQGHQSVGFSSILFPHDDRDTNWPVTNQGPGILIENLPLGHHRRLLIRQSSMW
jgi:hypothetical protein